MEAALTFPLWQANSLPAGNGPRWRILLPSHGRHTLKRATGGRMEQGRTQSRRPQNCMRWAAVLDAGLTLGIPEQRGPAGGEREQHGSEEGTM